MNRYNRNLPQLVVLVMLLCLTSVMILAKDTDFNRLVRHIEIRYGADRTRIPFLGFASLFTRLARPAGVADFHLAIFENLNAASDVELDDLIQKASREKWQPLVQVRSRKQGTATLIYAREYSSRFKLLVVTMENHQATLLEVGLSPNQLIAWLDDPRRVGKIGDEDGAAAPDSKF